jgi:hypothetical protein
LILAKGGHCTTSQREDVDDATSQYEDSESSEYGDDQHNGPGKESDNSSPPMPGASLKDAENSRGPRVALSIAPDILCCMKAVLCIPKKLGDSFSYYIDKCIPFPTDKKCAEEYLQAIIVLINTLFTGFVLAENIHRNSGRIPLPLCSAATEFGLKLIASPIPEANPVISETSSAQTGRKISQGELFSFEREEITSVKDWLTNFKGKWMTLLFRESEEFMNDSIVKVSCVSIHRSLISISACWTALQRVFKDTNLKATVAKVLLGCAQKSGWCLVVVMRELSDGGPKAASELWPVFARLVNNVLCPLAILDIIHADLRFDPINKNMCNILYYIENNTTEMGLIDFESLLFDPDCNFPRIKEHFAVTKTSVREAASTFKYLFWQVLWAAFVWVRRYDKGIFETVDAIVFVQESDDNFEVLSTYLKKFDVSELHECYLLLNGESIEAQEQAVKKTVRILSDFCDKYESSR